MAMPLNRIPPMIRLRYRDATPLRSDVDLHQKHVRQAECNRCGHVWPVKIPEVSLSEAGSFFPFAGGASSCRYLQAKCPNCDTDWFGDLGFTGAIQARLVPDRPLTRFERGEYDWEEYPDDD